MCMCVYIWTSPRIAWNIPLLTDVTNLRILVSYVTARCVIIPVYILGTDVKELKVSNLQQFCVHFKVNISKMKYTSHC